MLMNTIARDTFLKLIDDNVAGCRMRFLVEGREYFAGTGPNHSGVTVNVQNPVFFSRVLAFGNLGLGEAFIDRDFEVTGGSLPDFLTTLLRSRMDQKLGYSPRLLGTVLMNRAYSTLRGKGRRVCRYHDAGNDLFQAFLDSSLTFSSGYVLQEDEDLEGLQQNKLDRLCRKLQLGPADQLLDIGCGCGSLLMFAAQHYGASGVGITLSQEQRDRAQRLVDERGLGDRISILCRDYRNFEGSYTKVSAIGMMAHLRRSDYNSFFRTINRVMKPGALGMIHSYGCNSARNQHDAFLQRYIFPGSTQPTLSEITGNLGENGLFVLDVENNVRHCKYTFLQWLRNFRKNAPGLVASYGEKYLRAWEYYLSCGVAAAVASDSALYQVLFTNDRAAEIPLHRV